MNIYRSGDARLSTFSFWDNRLPSPMLYLDLDSKIKKLIGEHKMMQLFFISVNYKPLSYAHGLQFCWSAISTASSYSIPLSERFPKPNLYGLLLIGIGHESNKGICTMFN